MHCISISMVKFNVHSRMASAGSNLDLSQTDQSITQQPPQSNDIRKSEFKTVGTSQNSSKRPGAKCNHCQHEFEPKAATVDKLKQHILKECQAVPQDVRQHWLGVFSSKQASSTAGEQAVGAVLLLMQPGMWMWSCLA